MADHTLPQQLLQRLEEKVTMLLIHLDEANEKNRNLEQEVTQLKSERDHNINKLKAILELLDDTIKTSTHADENELEAVAA